MTRVTDRGYGSPSSPGDLGYGSPTALLGLDAEDLGYGSPTGAVAAFLETGTIYPDDGGEIVIVIGTWDPLDSYTIHLRENGGSVLYPPAADALGAYSCFPGEGVSCRARGRRLRFALPEAPPGLYDVLISGSLSSATMLAAVTIIYRQRSSYVDALRRWFPSDWRTGPAFPRDDVRLEAANETLIRADFPQTPLKMLTRAIGQELDIISGRPETVLTATLAEDDVTIPVETTLAFDTSGTVFIEGRRWTYSAKTATTLTGAAPEYLLGIAHAEGAYVALARGAAAEV